MNCSREEDENIAYYKLCVCGCNREKHRIVGSGRVGGIIMEAYTDRGECRVHKSCKKFRMGIPLSQLNMAFR